LSRCPQNPCVTPRLHYHSNMSASIDKPSKPTSSVIVLGSTGTGKSSLISCVTKVSNVNVNNGVDRVTQTNEGFNDEDNELLWLDTVGWDDKDLRDDDTFRSILKYLGTQAKHCISHYN